jgi:hypothetical protein
MPAPDVDSLLACPRCDAPLARAADAYSCGGCKVDFPDLGGLPFLFAEPGYARAEWRNRAQHALGELRADHDRCDRELTRDNAEATQRRLELLRNACAAQSECLSELLTPLLADNSPAPRETYLALRTRLPLDQGLNTYYQNIHRDWCWGDEENARSLELVAGKLPEHGGKVLVLGAGAGRLAYDLHQTGKPELCIAFDFNPLLALIGDALARGQTVPLWEFPIAPRQLTDTAIRRELCAGDAAGSGLRFVLGDVLRPPFRAASFDVVVTPWLVDILPVELGDLAARINTLLCDSGRWINFGSLAFTGPSQARRYSLEEVLEVVAQHGFAAPAWREDSLPYMCSPASRHGRKELVVTFGADKSKSVKPPARHTALPEWLVTGKEPVPALREFQLQAAQTRIYAFVMAMIDGKRSIRDMAVLMEQQKLMGREEAEASIRSFLTRMFDDTQRQP